MTRTLALAALLATTTGCMSLDFLVFSTKTVDAYTVDETYLDPNQVELVTFESLDGVTLHGAWVHHDPPGPPLIYFHGQSTTLNDTWERLAYYHAWGYDVFAVDYRGYGLSEGTATYEGVFETDGLATVQYVSETTGVPPEEIVWVALSMGAAVAAHTNDEIEAQALILYSMFPSTNLLGDDGTGNDLPTGWFFEDEYDNLDAVTRLTSPVFVIHGLQDDYINGPLYGPMTFEAAPEPKAFWQPEDVAHANLHELHPIEYRDRARAFFDEWGSVPALPE